MMISVTRLRLRSWTYLPEFMWHTWRSVRQLRRAPGFLVGKTALEARLTFWTLTKWETEKAMREFRGSGAHAQAMPRLAKWCDEASVAHWAEEMEGLPSWQQASARLAAGGRPSRVEHPSADHLKGKFAEPRIGRSERRFTPQR